jgi:hypothetical protein
MRKLIGSALLFGAMMVTTLAAQNAPTEKVERTTPTKYLEVAVTYDALHCDASDGHNFWMQGGDVQAEAYFSHGFGVVADLAGEHATNIQGSGVGLDIITMTFGPRYTWQPRRYRRSGLYGQALVGRANGFNSVFFATSGASSSANSLALKIGGGVDYTLTRRFAVRAFEADWLRTQLPNGNTNVQNNLRIGAGLILRFY